MEPNRKEDKDVRNYKMMCPLVVFVGLYSGIGLFVQGTDIPIFSPLLPVEDIPVFVNGALNTTDFSTITLIAVLLLPVMYLASGIFGYLKKISAVIVFSVFASGISLYLLIYKLMFVSPKGWIMYILEVIPLLASVVVPIMLIVCALAMKKHL